MLINYNVYVWTRRPVYNAATKATSAPQPYLNQVAAQIVLPTARDLQYAPGALTGDVDYILYTDVEVDINEGDTLARVTELDAVTAYPRNLVGSTRYTWKVRYVDASPPMLLPRRRVYLKLLRDGK